MSDPNYKAKNFIEEIIEEDIAAGKFPKGIHTRFPPEPNGYLHIGHATAICFNFEVAKTYGGKTNLRFDDTNPTTEETHYVEAIKNDIKWLGYDWEGTALFASDYFDSLYAFALKLIKKGAAYVDDSTAEEIATQKGTPTSPGTNSPNRDRSIEENLALFEKMKDGEYEDGAMVLRAKIDMSHPNMHMRDPLMYRIKKATHHRTGDKWCIYPMYDFAHGQSDSIEEITHSLCSLEFRHHRDLYNWFIEQLEIYPSRQLEFARRNVTYMITSKRRLMKLIDQGLVDSWDDPRMPTISGMRRRGYPAVAIRNFCELVGMSKRESNIEVEMLESCVRDELNKTANRAMVVQDPVKLVIENYPEGKREQLTVVNNQEDENSATHEIPFGREIYIERADFMEDPPKKFFRLGPERIVRLKSAYIIQCTGYSKDKQGNVTEITAKYFDNSKSGEDVSGIKSKGVLHWVSVEHGVPTTIHDYDRLFTDENPTGHEDKDYIEFYNHDSLEINDKAIMEPWLSKANPGDQFQFMRTGYYVLDEASTSDRKIFNRTVALKSRWKPGKK